MALSRQTADFFVSQSLARRRTWELGFLFIFAILFEIAAFSLAVAGVVHLKTSDGRPQPPFLVTLRTCAFFVVPAVLFILFIGYRWWLSEFKEGGYAVAAVMHGDLLTGRPQSPGDRVLQNIVEEMAVAAGVPTPAICVLHDEPSINAFAAGHAGVDAVVGVTAGAIQKLSREELQAILAHEFSHIINDAELDMRTLAVVKSLAYIYLAGRGMLYFWRDSYTFDEEKVLLPVGFYLALGFFGIVFLIVGWLGYALAVLVRAATCRQRERLADACAVQYTRNPQAVASALHKTLNAGSALWNLRTDQLNQFLFADGTANAWFEPSFLSVHRPIEQRIRAVDPAFMASQFARKNDLPAGGAGSV